MNATPQKPGARYRRCWAKEGHVKKIILVIMFFIAPVYAADDNDLSTILMKSTLRLSGGHSQGNCFIIGRDLPNDNTCLRYVLLTAHHVLSGMKEDTVTIILRQREMDNYINLPYAVPIRKNQH